MCVTLNGNWRCCRRGRCGGIAVDYRSMRGVEMSGVEIGGKS